MEIGWGGFCGCFDLGVAKTGTNQGFIEFYPPQGDLAFKTL